MNTDQEVTRLLIDWSNGDKAALDKLTPLVYQELRRLAHRHMNGERSDHTLQTTALVNEAYLGLIHQKEVHWQNRAQFFGLAARMMRNILIDYARTHGRAKRGGGVEKIQLDEATLFSPARSNELLVLDEALQQLERKYPRKSRVVELRYFGGLSVEETAEVLEVSAVTVMRDWNVAKAWLYREMTHDA
jgi:RNA polymerase sigma-70 factor (ECF subfamily)